MKKVFCMLIVCFMMFTLLTSCGEIKGSEGLEFASQGDGTCYVTGIGSCTDTELIIPSQSPDGEKVVGIDSCAFWGCTQITSVTIPNTITELPNGVFGCSGIESITIPDSITSIDNNAFFSCANLTSVTISKSVVKIGLFVFAGCTSLENLIVEKGNSVYHSENNCIIETKSKALVVGCKSSIIPDDGSVVSISEGAFDGMGLTSITIPNTIIDIDSHCISSNKLESFILEEGNSVYHFKNNCLIETESKILIKGFSNSTIPDDGSVTSIGEYAFYTCTGITSIVIPNSITNIGDKAFSSCKELASIIIPQGITIIGDCTFDGCEKLTSITLPNSITEIGSMAFRDCLNLTTVYFNGTEEEWKQIYISYDNEALENATIIFLEM